MTRGALRWRLTVPADGVPPGGGLLPALIQWDIDFATQHPSRVLQPRGVTLTQLMLDALPPEHMLLEGIEVAEPRIELRRSMQPGLGARFSTPRGAVEID